MHYHLSTNHIHLSPRTSKLLDRRMRMLSRHLPARLQVQPLQVTLKEDIAKNYVEGMVTLTLPGKVLVAKSRGRTIMEVVGSMVERMRNQVIAYKATHDAWHSDYPDKRSIRRQTSTAA